jgi:hypothetical protein
MERLTQVYIWGFIGMVIGTLIAISLGVFFNQAGIKGGNFVIAAIFLVAWAFFTFYPAFLAIAFGLGSLDGLPKDWSLKRLLKESDIPDLQLSEVITKGLEFVKKVVRWSSHLALFVTTVFVILGSWDIVNPRVILPVFVVLAGIGLLSSVFPTKTIWYRRTVTAILFVSLTGLLYTGYHYFHPQDKTVDEVEAALRRNEDNKMDRAVQAVLQKIRRDEILTEDEEKLLKQAKQERNARSLKGAVSNFFYTKTLEVPVSSLSEEVEISGVEPGTRKFSVPGQQFVLLLGTNTSSEINNKIRVNGVRAGENFEVAADGKIKVKFVGPPEFLKRPIDWQTLTLAFH